MFESVTGSLIDEDEGKTKGECYYDYGGGTSMMPPNVTAWLIKKERYECEQGTKGRAMRWRW